jgi:hypothetical protein
MTAIRQMSLFGVEARPPTPLDLEGLLAGAGQVTRMGGTARVSIVVDEPWRAAALHAECTLRGLAASIEAATAEGHLAFRTAYAAALAPLGARWLRGAVKHPPGDFTLDGRRLRLWVIAAGRPDGTQAYFLRLGPSDATRLPEFAASGEPVWDKVGGARAAAGLPAVLLGPRAGGPGYRIVGRRRLARLAELIGEPPSQAPPDEWPV